MPNGSSHIVITSSPAIPAATPDAATITIRRAARGYLLEAALWLPQPREAVFPFFADAGNLDRITPPSLRFRILEPRPAEMAEGALIDYRIRIRGIGIRWRTEITGWEPPVRFTDSQLRGPYRWWEHEHRFEEMGGGTLCTDRVSYGVPGGALIHGLFVQRDVLRIFRYRQERLRELFPPLPAG